MTNVCYVMHSQGEYNMSDSVKTATQIAAEPVTVYSSKTLQTTRNQWQCQTGNEDWFVGSRIIRRIRLDIEKPVS